MLIAPHRRGRAFGIKAQTDDLGWLTLSEHQRRVRGHEDLRVMHGLE